jgi:hypothetical protein
LSGEGAKEDLVIKPLPPVSLVTALTLTSIDIPDFSFASSVLVSGREQLPLVTEQSLSMPDHASAEGERSLKPS